MIRTRIIVPTYNEKENIKAFIDALFLHMPHHTRVLVVDDGSPDGTADLVREYMKKDQRVDLLQRPRKLGMGSAYQMAFQKVLDENNDDCIVTIDADFSHHPQYIPELVRASEGHHLVIGSRYIRGGGIANWNLSRRLLSKAGNLYSRYITGTPILDLTAGFSCMRTDFLKDVPYEKVQSKGYAWWIALRTLFHRRGAKICEVPIVFTERRLGKSKLSSNIIYEGLIEPWRIRFSKL